MQQSEALIMVAKVQAIWPQRELSEHTAREYVSALQDLTVERAGAAVERLKVSSRFMPSIAELRAEAMNVVASERVPDADQAWTEVREQLRRIGSKRGMLNFTTDTVWEPEWSHPAIGTAADTIGWHTLCNSENEMADRAHFLKLYEVTAQRERTQANLTPFGRELTAMVEGAGPRELPVEV